MYTNKTIKITITAFALAFVLGCGSSSELEKVIVEGKVSYQGEPVKNGEIRFHPTQDTLGPVSGAPIVDGAYKVVSKGGVSVGTHIVRIEAYKPSGGGGGGDMISGGVTGVPVNYLPAKYHRQSELTIVIEGDKSRMTKDYELE